MTFKLCVRKGYEDTTIRNIRDLENNKFGIIGTVADLLKYGVFDYCTADPNKWAALPNDHTAIFTESQESAIEILKKEYFKVHDKKEYEQGVTNNDLRGM